MAYTANKKSKYCYTVEEIPLVPITTESKPRFLASDIMSGYVTGQVIDVNGGMIMP